jgi:hypothetical protein
MYYTFTATADAKKSKERLKNIKFQSDIKGNVPAVYKVQYKLYLRYSYVEFYINYKQLICLHTLY